MIKRDDPSFFGRIKDVIDSMRNTVGDVIKPKDTDKRSKDTSKETSKKKDDSKK